MEIFFAIKQVLGRNIIARLPGCREADHSLISGRDFLAKWRTTARMENSEIRFRRSSGASTDLRSPWFSKKKAAADEPAAASIGEQEMYQALSGQLRLTCSVQLL
jgi:hypothetical protein